MNFDLLYTEINIISLVLIAILSIKMKTFKQMKAYPQFIRALLFLIIFIVSDLFSYLMRAELLPKINSLILLFKTLYFISATIQGLYWLFYFEYRGETNIAKEKKYQYLLFMLVLVQVIMQIANLRHGFFFRIGADGNYERGPLFFIQYLPSYSLMAIAIGRALYFALFQSNYLDKSYISTLIAFPILPAIAGIIQYFNGKIPVAGICLTLSALLLYMDELENLVFIDPLTGLNNRRNFIRLVSQKMKTYTDSDHLFLLMIDVDYFKKINDTYGHTEGDQALICISNALNRASIESKNRVSIGRFGGDEFIAIVEADNKETVISFITTIHQLLKMEHEQLHAPYGLSLSIGFAEYKPEFKMVNDFINAADEHLYEIKEQRHQRA